MKIKFSIFIVFFYVLFSPLTATANLEIKSENIIFYGDVKPEDGERLVRNLEIYRSVILTLSKVENRPDRVPLRIYAFKNSKPLNKFIGGKGIAGLYTEGREGPMFLTVSKGGFKGNKWSSQVALHEYSHHVLHALTKDNYPRWYDEGFANYLSTFDITDDIITIGAPKVNHGRAMKNGAWMSPEKVLSSIHRYPRTRRIDKFYGQSWLYVHYLQNTSELSSKLPVYLETLKTQKDPVQAFENSFGLTVKEFQKKVRLYWNKNSFPITSFKASSKLLDHKTSVKVLTDQEFELAFAKARINFLDKKSVKKFEKQLINLEAELGQRADLKLLLAEAAMISESYNSARQHLSAAIKHAEIDSNLLRLRGDIQYHKLWSEQFGKLQKYEAKIFRMDDHLRRAVKYFEEALILDNSNKTSNLHLLSLLGRSKADVSHSALQSVERTYELYLKPNDIGEYIDIANVMARTGRKLRACDNYKYVKGRVEDYEDKNVNDDFARLRLFEQEYPNVCG